MSDFQRIPFIASKNDGFQTVAIIIPNTVAKKIEAISAELKEQTGVTFMPEILCDVILTEWANRYRLSRKDDFNKLLRTIDRAVKRRQDAEVA